MEASRSIAITSYGWNCSAEAGQLSVSMSRLRLAQGQIRIFGVSCEIVRDKSTDHIHPQMMLARVVERSPGQHARGAAKRFGDLGLKQREHIAGQGVVECRHVSVTLQFKAPGCYQRGSITLFVAE